jgi:PIN domain nuclease of toxin-antitoxin system
MAQKPRLGKWAEIEPFVGRLASMNEKQGGLIADIDRDIVQSAGELVWDHRDPFDRMIAATALKRRLVLISADVVFDEVVQRIW